MNDNLNKEVITLPPFKRLCMTIGELPSSYVETMTYYESLLWFCNYLGKTVIPTINNNAEAVEELQTKYIELKDYVDNYFENLDVQEEINNKLDEMAESGELADIIAQYLQVASVLAFDTKAALKAAENLVDGSITKTIGDITYNDGKGNFYKIRTLTSSDVIDDDLIVALTNYPTLIAEKLPDYRLNQIENKIPNIEDEINELNNNFNNNKNGLLNLMNYIMYDFGTSYYIQGMAINNNDLYVYKEYNDANGKLMKFNISNDTYVSESSVDLKHGNDMTIINNVLYSTNCDNTKKITICDLVNFTTSEITLNVDESQIACLTKEDNDNLLLLANNGYGSNFSGCSIYRYNISTETLTKLTINNNMFTNFYAIQSFVYLKGYLYLLVSSPNQIIKIKVDDSSVTFENLYNIPNIDNIGLNIGEVEGIDIAPAFGENALMITTQIEDSTEIGRTMKTYIINPINNTPDMYLHYPNIIYNDDIERVDRIYVDNGTNLIEFGTQAYPFHTINRAINSLKNRKNVYDILLYNSASQIPFNLYVDTINNVRAGISTVNNNIQLNYKRIINSDLVFSGEAVLTLKNKEYTDGWRYGNIANSKVLFDDVNFDIRDGINLYKSDIKFYNVTGTANNSDNWCFRIRLNSTVMDGTNWANNWTLNGKKAYQLYGVGILYKVSDVGMTASDQLAFKNTYVDNASSTAFAIIFNGSHTVD